MQRSVIAEHSSLFVDNILMTGIIYRAVKYDIIIKTICDLQRAVIYRAIYEQQVIQRYGRLLI